MSARLPSASSPAFAKSPALRSTVRLTSLCARRIVSLNVGDIDSAEISDALMQGWGIATRPGAHCAPLMHRALGTERQGIVRFSFGYFNTAEEVDTAIDALRDLAC